MVRLITLCDHPHGKMIRAKDNNPTESVSNDVRKTHDIIKKSGQKIISVEYAGTSAFQRGIQDPRPVI